MLAVTIKAFIRDERGATVIEYGLIAALISIALIASTAVFGDSLQALFNNGTAEVLAQQAAKIN